jgi:hypothetical protein
MPPSSGDAGRQGLLVQDRSGARAGGAPGPDGDRGEKITLKIVARHIHTWNGFDDRRETGRRSEILGNRCERWHDPSVTECSILIPPNQVKKADACADTGITYLMSGFANPDLSHPGDLAVRHDSRNGG